jgi:hypothetical protein
MLAGPHLELHRLGGGKSGSNEHQENAEKPQDAGRGPH